MPYQPYGTTGTLNKIINMRIIQTYKIVYFLMNKEKLTKQEIDVIMDTFDVMVEGGDYAFNLKEFKKFYEIIK